MALAQGNLCQVRPAPIALTERIQLLQLGVHTSWCERNPWWNDRTNLSQAL